MSRDDIRPPAAIYYRCLGDVQRQCDCTLLDQMLGRDCGVQMPLPKPTKDRRP